MDPLLAKAASVAQSEGIKLLKALTEKTTRDFIVKRDQLMDDWWSELVQLVRDLEARMSAVEQEQEVARLDDHEALGVLVNFIDDAYREPLDERRRMLAHAASGIANLKLSIGEYARVWRVIRELDPEDVLVLYGLFLVPHRQPKAEDAKSRGNLVYTLWEKTHAEALLASGCLLVRTGGGGMGHGPWEEIDVAFTGIAVLRALRSYITTRKPALTVPGHEVTAGFRAEEDAWRAIREVPGLYDALLRAAQRFDWSIQYDAPNIAGGAPHNGRAQLVVRRMNADDAKTVAEGCQPLGVEFGLPVDKIGVAIHGGEDGFATVHVEGPHDVLRVLAYDLDAVWG